MHRIRSSTTPSQKNSKLKPKNKKQEEAENPHAEIRSVAERNEKWKNQRSARRTKILIQRDLTQKEREKKEWCKWRAKRRHLLNTPFSDSLCLCCCVWKNEKWGVAETQTVLRERERRRRKELVRRKIVHATTESDYLMLSMTN